MAASGSNAPNAPRFSRVRAADSPLATPGPDSESATWTRSSGLGMMTLLVAPPNVVLCVVSCSGAECSATTAGRLEAEPANDPDGEVEDRHPSGGGSSMLEG